MRVATGSFFDDVQHSLRMLRRSPGLSFLAIVVIGLGIGTNTAVYSIVHALADRPLQFRHAARTVMIWQTDRTKGIDHGIVSPADFLDWRERALPVAVISETVERRFLGAKDAVGQTITMRFPGAKAPWRPEQPTMAVNVVGVVRDLREWQWNDPHYGELYVSYRQNPSRLMRLAIKSSDDPLRLTSSITHEIDRMGSTPPVMEVKTMDAIVSEALRRRRLIDALLGIFASFALMLSAIGLYAAISYSVAQRTHEIGLRIALGASRQRITRLILSEGMRLALAGTALGELATLGAMRVLENAFFGIAGIHLVELAVVAAILGTTAILAAGVPALRASRLDPAVALRDE